MECAADECWIGRWWVDFVLFIMREAVCDGFKVVLIDGVESRFGVDIWKYETIPIHFSTWNTEIVKAC